MATRERASSPRKTGRGQSSRSTRKPAARAPARRDAPAQQTRGHVLVTGASAGIGALIAREFAARGFDLVLVARSRDKLARLAQDLDREHGRKAEVVPLDLTRSSAPDALVRALERRGIAVQILVNNAGVLEMGRFAQIPERSHLGIVDLNVRALTALTHRFLNPMLAAGHGRILNVASTAGFQPLPSLTSYAASKAYVLSFSEALSEELKGSGVTVTALCPGITDTAMYGTMKRAGKHAAEKLPRFLLSDPREVAVAGVKACLNGEALCVPGLWNEISTMTTHTAPKWLVRALFGATARQIL